MSNIIDIHSKGGISEAEALQLIQKTTEQEKLKPAKFLAAWKRGIKLVGGNFFDLQVNIDKATDKNQLRPNYEVISQSLRVISTGQAHFLALMYSFYNSDDGQQMLEKLGRPNIADVTSLPDEYLEVISELMLNYQGW